MFLAGSCDIMDTFESRIASLDIGLFEHIPSQSTPRDKRSLLALHLGFRQQVAGFVYLEIGSAFGGSLQALAADPVCAKIISIDPRPKAQPDERGKLFPYPDNSTDRMLQLLKQVPGAKVEKIQTFEAGTDTLTPSALPCQPNLCFVDGEHTDRAVVRDAHFCLSAVKKDGCVVFHDANIVYRGIQAVIEELSQGKRPFHAYLLPDCLFVIELGACPIGQCAHLREMISQNYEGYLWSLLENDHFRELAKRPIMRWAKFIDDKMNGFAKRLSRPRSELRA